MANIDKKVNVFWLYEPSVLFRNNNYMHFIPNGQYTFIQNLNAITLFCIYLAIILLILFPNKIYACIPLILIIIIIFVYFLFKDSQKSTNIEKQTPLTNKETKELSYPKIQHNDNFIKPEKNQVIKNLLQNGYIKHLKHVKKIRQNV